MKDTQQTPRYQADSGQLLTFLSILSAESVMDRVCYTITLMRSGSKYKPLFSLLKSLQTIPELSKISKYFYKLYSGLCKYYLSHTVGREKGARQKLTTALQGKGRGSSQSIYGGGGNALQIFKILNI